MVDAPMLCDIYRFAFLFFFLVLLVVFSILMPVLSDPAAHNRLLYEESQREREQGVFRARLVGKNQTDIIWIQKIKYIGNVIILVKVVMKEVVN